MDIQQIAKRAATKRNNKTAKELPLLALTGTIPSEFLTTSDEQQARIESQRADFEIWWAGLLELDRDFLRRAEQYRAELAGMITLAELIALDIAANQPWRKRIPVYLADFWHCRLRDHLKAIDK